MPIQYVNTGSSSNKGDGDSIRLAFTKVNNNFSQISGFFVSTGTASFFELEVSGDANISNLISNTGTFQELYVSDIFSVGTYLGFDDSQIVKNKPGGLSQRLLNTFPQSNSSLIFSDWDQGNFIIGHQNSAAPSFNFPAGGNFIFSDNPSQSITIGLYSDINFYASEAKWFNPLLPIVPSISIQKSDGGVIVNKTMETIGILPQTNLTYDLGSPSKQWRSLYVGTSTIYLGGTALSVSGGSLTVDGSPVTGGGTATTSTLVNDSYTVSLSTTGNLTLPGIIVGTGNLQLASSQGSVDAGRYLRLRDGDVESHIHIDSPDNNTYDLIFGDDSKYIRVDHTGTVVIGNNGSLNTWTFSTDGSLTFPDGTTSTGATVFANSSSYKIQTISFGGSPSNVVSTFEFGVASMTIPGNGIIYNEGQEGYWALDGANKQFTFPNLSRISYGLGNAGLTVDDLKIQSVNTGNVVVSANGEDWVFRTNGTLTFPDATVQTTAYKSTSGSWTLATGSNTVSITVPLNGNYQMWVNGNIPNGIVEWNATVNVSNPNVPAIGSQYAWYYAAGNALVLTAIPDQIEGTAGVISTSSSYVGNTANVFTFGITNNSTSSQVINWGYTTL